MLRACFLPRRYRGCKKIGFIYLNNEELKDVPKAIEWYEKGLSLGEYSLNFDLAYVYLNDGFVPHDYEKGLKYLLDGVHHNDPESLYMYARVRETGMYKVEPDKKAYIYYLKKAAALGQDDALLDLGYYYYDKGKYDDALDCFASSDLNVVGLYWAMATIYEAKRKITKTRFSIIVWQWKMIIRTLSREWRKRISATNLDLKRTRKPPLNFSNEPQISATPPRSIISVWRMRAGITA